MAKGGCRVVRPCYHAGGVTRSSQAAHENSFCGPSGRGVGGFLPFWACLPPGAAARRSLASRGGGRGVAYGHAEPASSPSAQVGIQHGGWTTISRARLHNGARIFPAGEWGDGQTQTALIPSPSWRPSARERGLCRTNRGAAGAPSWSQLAEAIYGKHR